MQQKKLKKKVGGWGQGSDAWDVAARCGCSCKSGLKVALKDCPKGQTRIGQTDRLSRQTAECVSGRRHIWKNWVLAGSTSASRGECLCFWGQGEKTFRGFCGLWCLILCCKEQRRPKKRNVSSWHGYACSLSTCLHLAHLANSPLGSRHFCLPYQSGP